MINPWLGEPWCPRESTLGTGLQTTSTTTKLHCDKGIIDKLLSHTSASERVFNKVFLLAYIHWMQYERNSKLFIKTFNQILRIIIKNKWDMNITIKNVA